MFGFLSSDSSLWLWVTPIISGVFLAATGGLLIWDLEHPKRFHLIFVRPQWKSWLVKGAFVIAAYSIVLLVHFLASCFGAPGVTRKLMIAGIPLSASTAIYTAYLFAQAKARDMWQNPLLPPHLLIQAMLLGSASLLPLASRYEPTTRFGPNAITTLLWILAVTSLLHILMVWGEVSLSHPTAHARLAIWEMVRGRYHSDFWIGIALSTLGGLIPWLALLGVVSSSLGIGAAPMALIGLMLHENAYVQAGQSVPLA
jgi:formate-dependent nitrite reductase membrane component NrfD